MSRSRRSKWAVAVMVAAITATHAAAQVQQAPAVQCFAIKGTKTCPAYEGAMVPVTNSYTDTMTFDAFVTSRISNQTKYITQFRTGYGCPTFNGLGTRYANTLLCSMLVQSNAAICTQTVKIMPICKYTCNQAVASVSALFANPRVCPAPAAAAATNRNTTLSSYQAFCAQQTIVGPAPAQCLDGSKSLIDSKSCGFLGVNEVTTYCNANVGRDPCCARSFVTVTTTVRRTTTATPTTTVADNAVATTDPAATATAIASNTAKSKFLLATNTMIIIGASVGGVILLSVIGFVVYRRNRAARMSNGSAGMYKSRRGLKSLLTLGIFKSTPSSRGAGKVSAKTPVTPVPIPLQREPPQLTPTESSNMAGMNDSYRYTFNTNTESQYLGANKYPSFMVQDSVINPPDHNADRSTFTASMISPPNLPPPPFTARVVARFVQSMSDELEVSVNDTVEITEVFDDGWARGINLSTDNEGVLPVVCIVPAAQRNPNTMSMASRPDTYGNGPDSMYTTKRSSSLVSSYIGDLR